MPAFKSQNGTGRPSVRWKAADLEEAIVADLEKLRLPTPEIADWFRKSLHSAFVWLFLERDPFCN